MKSLDVDGLRGSTVSPSQESRTCIWATTYGNGAGTTLPPVTGVTKMEKKIISIAPTFTCQKKCEGCYLTTNVTKDMRDKELSTESWKNVISSASSQGYTELAIALNPGKNNYAQCFELIAHAKSLDLEVNVTTTVEEPRMTNFNGFFMELIAKMAYLIDRRPLYDSVVKEGEKQIKSLRDIANKAQCSTCKYYGWDYDPGEERIRRHAYYRGDESDDDVEHFRNRTNYINRTRRNRMKNCPDCHALQHRARMELAQAVPSGGAELIKSSFLNAEREHNLRSVEDFCNGDCSTDMWDTLQECSIGNAEVILDNLTLSCDDIHGYESMGDFWEVLERWLTVFDDMWSAIESPTKQTQYRALSGRREISPIGTLTINLLWTPVVMEWFMTDNATFKGTLNKMMNYEGVNIPSIDIHHLVPKPLDCFGNKEELIANLAEIATEHPDVGLLGEHENTIRDAAFGHMFGLNAHPSDAFDMLDIDPMGNVRRCPETPEVLTRLGFGSRHETLTVSFVNKKIEHARKQKLAWPLDGPCGCMTGKRREHVYFDDVLEDKPVTDSEKKGTHSNDTTDPWNMV